MRKDVQLRMRRRIRDRLDELGMTARELARDVGHDDAWISGILKGSQGLHWKDFDAVAKKLQLAPSELVREDETELRELTPIEMQFLRHVQNWPLEIRNHWMALFDHFAASTPDRETAAFLDRLRAVPRSLRRPVIAWLQHLLEEGIPPEVVPGGGGGGSGAAGAAPGTKHRSSHGEK